MEDIYSNSQRVFFLSQESGKCLYFEGYLPVNVPVEITKLTSLEELTGVVFTKGEDEEGNVDYDVEALRNLTHLRVLSFWWPSSGLPLKKIVILVKLLGKLDELESLKIIHDELIAREFLLSQKSCLLVLRR